ncbi:MAG TPA: limonene-1,2-epoxide hydrolase [Lactobacillus sp.]|nr:limonene-1,2-epoxide hydrolase [Lactobacillus sp.]
MAQDDFSYKAGAEPFFNIVMKGLGDRVTGNNFWEACEPNATFEFMYHFPGVSPIVNGRDAYHEWFKGYNVKLTSADGLRVYPAEDGEHVTLEYTVHGSIPTSGKNDYENRFCSVVTIKNHKIVYWRDYMDSLAAMLGNQPQE